MENAKTVELGAESFPVQRTPKKGLRQVDFTFDGNDIRGLEQNPPLGTRRITVASNYRNHAARVLQSCESQS